MLTQSAPEQKICQNPSCSAPIIGRASKKFCSTKCKNASHNSVTNAKKLRTYDKVCAVCAKPFVTTDNRVVACSKACKTLRHMVQLRKNTGEVKQFAHETRLMFLATKSSIARNKIADALIIRAKKDTIVRQAFYLHSIDKIPFLTNANYDPLPSRPLRSDAKNKTSVMLYTKYDDATEQVDYVVKCFTDRVPRRLKCYIDSICIGTYAAQQLAEAKKQEIERILSYEDARTQLLLEHRLVEHNLEEANIRLDSINNWVDVFDLANKRCRKRHGVVVSEYARNDADTVSDFLFEEEYIEEDLGG